MNKFYAAILACAVLTLTACGDEDSEPPEYDRSSSDIGREALRNSWELMSGAERDSICDGYILIPETTIETIRKGNEDYLTRADVRDFLDINC